MAGFLSFVGIEYESPYLIRGRTPAQLQEWFAQDHDASIETPAFVDESGQIYSFRPKSRNVNSVILGTEFVSRPIPVKDFEMVLRKLVGYLNENGEPECAPRCGIHYHISMAYNIDVLKNIIQLARFSEQVFYYAGSFGQQFRGMQNDFTYCRPITRFGPSVVSQNDRYYQVFTIEDLLEAEDTTEFFMRYGGLNEFSPAGKYHPVRYGWITLYPLLTKGTVEFRVFNKTTTVPYLLSAFELCKAFLARCMGSKMELEENSIYSMHTKDGVLSTLYALAEMIDLNPKHVSNLELAIKMTPEIAITNQYMHTHLRNSTFAGFGSYSPKRSLDSSRIARPNFVDIHTLGH